MKSTHYRGSIDGDIIEYLKETKDSGQVRPTFKGYEPYEQLWKIGAVYPQITAIRLMFNFSRGDECYTVVDKDHAEGVSLNVHSGKSGIHNIKELLTKTEAKYWEASMLNPKVYRD